MYKERDCASADIRKDSDRNSWKTKAGRLNVDALILGGSEI